MTEPKAAHIPPPQDGKTGTGGARKDEPAVLGSLIEVMNMG